MKTHNDYRGRRFWTLNLEERSEIGIELEGSRTHVTAHQKISTWNDVFVGHDFRDEFKVKPTKYSWATILDVYDAMLAIEEADRNAANT